MLFSDMLYVLVRYASPSGPMCLRCLMLTLSGPVELLFLLCLISTWTCVVVSVILVVCSLWVFLYICLFVLCGLCLTMSVNTFAICVGECFLFKSYCVDFACRVYLVFWDVVFVCVENDVC